MKPPGEIIIDAVIRASAIETAVKAEGATIFVWSANAAEQIEAALQESGYELRPQRTDQPDDEK